MEKQRILVYERYNLDECILEEKWLTYLSTKCSFLAVTRAGYRLSEIFCVLTYQNKEVKHLPSRVVVGSKFREITYAKAQRGYQLAKSTWS